MNTGEDVTKQGTDPWKSFMDLYRIDIAWIRVFLCANIVLTVTLIAITVKLL